MLLDQFFRVKRSPALTESLRCGLASVSDYERRMCESADSSVVDYCRGGAASEQTVAHNRAAFDRLIIRPRCLQRIGGSRSLAVASFGVSYRMPIGIAPVALQCLAHPEGEKAMARAARTYGVPFVLSVLSSVSIEELAEAVPRAPKWFQLYIFKDRELTECLVRRAEKARFRALVVSVDTPAPGLSRTERRNPLTLPAKVTCANFVPNGNSSNGKAKSCSASVLDYVRSQLDPSLGWDAIQWLMSITTLPVILKGILNRADALIAADIGVHGLIVSNSGGRQLDCAPAAIEVLPEIVGAVGDRIEVMLDSGVSQGTDVFKALALGARMVFVGRAAVYGLAVNGQRGVEEVLDILKTELESTMLNAGCGTLADVTPQHVCHEAQLYYPSAAFDRTRISWRGDSFRSERYRSHDRRSKTQTLDSAETIQDAEHVDDSDIGTRKSMENVLERVTFQQRCVDTDTQQQPCPEIKNPSSKFTVTIPPPYRNVPLQLSVPRGIFRSNTNNVSKSGCAADGNIRTARTVINRKDNPPRRLKSHSMQNLANKSSGTSVCNKTCIAMDHISCALNNSTKTSLVNVPLVIGPISITNAALQQHASVYRTAAKVAERFQLPYVHTLRTPLSIEEFNGRNLNTSLVRWLEVFPFADLCVLRSLVRRAERSGFDAFVLSLMEPCNSVTSIFDKHAHVCLPHIRFPDLQLAMDEVCNFRSENAKQPFEEEASVSSYVRFFRNITEIPIIAYIPTTHTDLVYQALQAGVDGVCVVIDEYTPFPRFVGNIQAIKNSAFRNIPIYAGGSSFTETEVVELLACGVERVMIDQPIIWGFIIDEFNGISD
uniref:FMN hydroxy acid dehydrogenase domain-containing protein n=1 Tax=Anopheles epiroticus TaxID=199890 RepID=A0A182PSB6_9DIPT